MTTLGAVCYDDYGRPFVLLTEERDEGRPTGLEALKSHILAARGVANTLRSSLGPKSMDKLLMGSDGEVVITNDGATILELMEVENEVAKLMVSLAQSQDQEVGDGTTGVVVLAGALLERSLELLDKGIHPGRIADGYELAVRSAVQHLQKILFPVFWSSQDLTLLCRAAETALGSKMARKSLSHLAQVAVDALAAVCDLDQSKPELHLNSILIKGKCGSQMEDTEVIRGVVLEQGFAHPQMKKSFENVKIAVFTSTALQLPRVSTKHQLDVKDSKGFKDIRTYIQNWCDRAVKSIVNAGAELVFYSGKIEDDIIHLLLQRGISAVEMVAEINMIAVSVGAKSVPKVDEISEEKLGRADTVRVINVGITGEKMICVEQLGKANLVTIFVRGSNEVVVAELKRSLQDALCVVRNLIKDNKAVWGGGAAEIWCSMALQEESLKIPRVEQLVLQAFADALEVIPLALAENSGLYPLQVLADLKTGRQPFLGVDCMLTGNSDMSRQWVFEGLEAKSHQWTLATQLAKMVLKIDDIRGPKDQIIK